MQVKKHPYTGYENKLPDVVVCIFNLSTWEAKVDKSLQVWAQPSLHSWVLWQPGLCKETLSQRNHKFKKLNKSFNPELYIFQKHLFVCLSVWESAHMFTCAHVCLVPEKIGRGHQVPCTRVTESCEQQYGWKESKAGPLEEQSALLTSEPSPHRYINLF